MWLGSPTSAASSVLSTALSSDSMWFLLTCGFLSFGLRLFFLEWSAWKRRGGKKSRPRFTAFLEYRLDFFFSSYWWSKLAALSFLTILLIIGGAVTIATHTRLVAPPAVDGRESGGGTTSGGDGAPPAEAQDGAGAGEGNNSLIGAVLPGFGSALWDAWTFVADPGTHADVVGAGSRTIAFVLTLGGMLVFALVIGIIGDALSGYVDSMKKGRSAVFEREHTLICGWGDKLLPVINQIALANESEGGDVIVVMADKDKEEMEMTVLGSSELCLRGSTLVFRSGSPCILDDLRRVAANKARAVVLLADPALEPEESDAQAVRSVLGLSGLGAPCHIVVDVSDADSLEMVRLVGGASVEAMCSHDMIGRIMLQCARQSGLAAVLQSLMGFEGCEFYFEHWPQLVGMTFEEILTRFDDAIPIGIKPARAAIFNGGGEEGGEEDGEDAGEDDGGGEEGDEGHTAAGIVINPDPSTVFRDGDLLCVIAEDNDTYRPRDFGVPYWQEDDGFSDDNNADDDCDVDEGRGKLEHVLFCGWRRDMDDMIMELDRMVAPGSTLTLMCAVAIHRREKMLLDGGLRVKALKNLHLIHRCGSHYLRKDLEVLPLEHFDSIIVFADESFEANMTMSDSRSLACLVLVRDIQKKRARDCGTSRGSAAEQKLSNGGVGGDEKDTEEGEEEGEGEEEEANELDGYTRRELQVLAKRRGIRANGKTADIVTAILADMKQGSSGEFSGRGANQSGRRVSTGGNKHGATLSLSRSRSGSLFLSRGGEERGNGGGIGRRGAREYLRPEIPPCQRCGYECEYNSEDEDGGGANHANMQDGEDGGGEARGVYSYTEDEDDERIRLTSNMVNRGKTKQRHTLISEMLDIRTRSLVEFAGISDVVLSNEIVSMALAMVAEDRKVNAVLSEVLSEWGNEIYLRDCRRYLCPFGDDQRAYDDDDDSDDDGSDGDACREQSRESVASFFDIMVRCRSRNEIAIGYRINGAGGAGGVGGVGGGDGVDGGRLYLNPADKAVPRTWKHGDQIVVLACM